MKVLLGPTNFSNQPMALTRALARRGVVDASHVTYAWGGRIAYGFDHDEVVELDRRNWLGRQLAFVDQALERGVQVFHLWNRSLVYEPGGLGFFSGLDLPFLKAAGAKIIYRFTGYELRRRSVDLAVNPNSVFRRGYESPYDEEIQARYLDHLREWVDCFLVQDPEMRTFIPEAEIIPRGLDLAEFDFVGVEDTVQPLIVHAPTSRTFKGTQEVLDAIEQLRERGLPFDFKLLEGVAHAEVVSWLRRADIVIDQVLLGWYGVFAVEAMALGKPLVVHIRDSLSQGFEPALPVVNATSEDLADQLAALLVDPGRRMELARRSRAFVEEVHDIDKVAQQAEALYQRVTGATPATRRPHLRYLELVAGPPVEAMAKAVQLDRLKDELPALRLKARNYDLIKDELPALRYKAAQYDAWKAG